MRTLLFAILFMLSMTPIMNSQAEPGKLEPKKGPPGIRQVEPDTAADLTGYYECRGEEAGGKKYSGVVTMMKKNDVYVISWVVGGGASFSGIAIRQGNNVSASWAIASERGIVKGTNLYRVEGGEKGPRLVGRWASIPGPGIQQPETLTFLKAMDPPEKD